jgi:hypothetical protein
MKTAPQLPGYAGRADAGVAEWSGSMVRGLAALEFLDRSSDMASEAVVAMPVRAAVTDVRCQRRGAGGEAGAERMSDQPAAGSAADGAERLRRD